MLSNTDKPQNSSNSVSQSDSCFLNPPNPHKRSFIDVNLTRMSLGGYFRLCCFPCLCCSSFSTHTDTSSISWSQGSYAALRWCNPEPVINPYPLSASGLTAMSDSIAAQTACTGRRDVHSPSDAPHVEPCTAGLSSFWRWSDRYYPTAAKEDTAANSRVFSRCLQTFITVSVCSPQEGSCLRPLVNCLTRWVIHHVWLDSHASDLWSVTKVLLCSFMHPVDPETTARTLMYLLPLKLTDFLLCESISFDIWLLVGHPVFYRETPCAYSSWQCDWMWLNADVLP